MTERITQSFIKTMREYLAGIECGNLVKRQYIDNQLVDRKSDDMAEGSYFEFILTGALPKSKIVPQPVYMETPLKKKKPQDLTVDDMTAEYRRIHANAKYVKGCFKKWGWKILFVGQKLTKGRFEGTVDIIVECTKTVKFAGVVWKKGDRLCVDVKYTGLLHDIWEKFGWMWSDIQKEYHGTQAKQYHFISDLPFYFLVVGKNNKEEKDADGNKVVPPPEMALFHVPVSGEMLQLHISEGNYLYGQLEVQNKLGFIARPGFIRCSKCPLKDTCEDAHHFPHAESVDITIY